MASPGNTAAAPAGPSEADKVMDLCTAHWKQQALRAAVKLGVFDTPGLSLDAALPISRLASHTSASEEHLYRLLRYVAQFGLLEELPGQQFRLTSMGRYLQADHPSGLCHAAVSFGDAGQFVPWLYLGEAVKTGKCGFDFFAPQLPGGYFQYLGLQEHKGEEEAFNKLMTTFTKTMDSAAKLHDFSGCRVVADLGGGYGRLSEDIMELYPGVQEGVVLELPFVVDTLPELDSRFKGRIRWIKGDFFKEVPVQADCYVMKSILHDWCDERCLAILANLRAAMPPGSKLVNFDRLMPEFGTPGFHPAKGMDINMLTMVGGKERTTQQWHQLFNQAGFTISSVVETPSMAAIVAVPSSG